jgi:hypothetical protein
VAQAGQPDLNVSEAAGPGTRAEPGAPGEPGTTVVAGPSAAAAGEAIRLHGEVPVRGSKRVPLSWSHEGRFGRMFRRLPAMIPVVGDGRWAKLRNLGSPRFILLGTVAAVHIREVEGRVIETSVGTMVDDPLNLGIVFKASAIDDCVDQWLGQEGIKRGASAAPPPSSA